MCFRHVNRRPTNVSIRRCDYEIKAQEKKSRERPMKTQKQTSKKRYRILGPNEKLDVKPNTVMFQNSYDGIRLYYYYYRP